MSTPNYKIIFAKLLWYYLIYSFNNLLWRKSKQIHIWLNNPRFCYAKHGNGKIVLYLSLGPYSLPLIITYILKDNKL